MTGTSVERNYITGAWELLPNDVISDVMLETMNAVGPIDYSAADREFAAELHETIEESTLRARLDDLPEAARQTVAGESLHTEPFERTDAAELMLGSTDVSDVSWITPTAQFRAASWPIGTRPHTWQAVAASGGFGRKSAPYAAKILAGTAYELFTDPERLAAATAEFEAATSGREYYTPLPDDAEPPFNVGFGPT
jgi:aminobenzoyl-glutamate utilization protein B